jgi:hypothetical protein
VFRAQDALSKSRRIDAIVIEHYKSKEADSLKRERGIVNKLKISREAGKHTIRRALVLTIVVFEQSTAASFSTLQHDTMAVWDDEI